MTSIALRVRYWPPIGDIVFLLRQSVIGDLWLRAKTTEEIVGNTTQQLMAIQEKQAATCA